MDEKCFGIRMALKTVGMGGGRKDVGGSEGIKDKEKECGLWSMRLPRLPWAGSQ